MRPTWTQPRRAYSRSASLLAVSRTRSVLPATRADRAVLLGHEQHALAARGAVGDLAPERAGAVARERAHEADRRAAIDALDQHVGESVEHGVVPQESGAPRAPSGAERTSADDLAGGRHVSSLIR
jgi:hypothetical protein